MYIEKKIIGYFSMVTCTVCYTFNQLHAVSRTQHGRQREASVETLRLYI